MRSPTRGNFFQSFILIWSIAVQICLSFVLYYVLGIYDLMTTQIIFSFLLHLPILLFYLIKFGKNSNEVFKIRWCGFKNILYAVGFFLFMNPMFTLISYATSFFVPNTIGDSVSNLIEGKSIWLAVFAMAVMPAVFEELTYRGTLYFEYEEFPMKKAAFVNGLFFGIMHLNVHQFFYAFVIGYLLTFIVHHMKSIIPAMIVHFFINAPQVAMIFGLSLEQYNLPEVEMKVATREEEIWFMMIYTILTVACLPIAMSIYKKMKIHNSKTVLQKVYFADDNKNIEIQSEDYQNNPPVKYQVLRISFFVPLFLFALIIWWLN